MSIDEQIEEKQKELNNLKEYKQAVEPEYSHGDFIQVQKAVIGERGKQDIWFNALYIESMCGYHVALYADGMKEAIPLHSNRIRKAEPHKEG